MGPTASGKTDLALAIADQGPFEIVSVDSALVYRHMDIGTAKPGAEVLARHPHHLIDIREPSEPYSAADFRADAIRVADDIAARGRIPLFVGGTMLYFKALRDGLAALPSADEAVRARIAAEARLSGWPAVHARLAEIDPVAAARINPNDPQRLQRALEVYEISGKSMTALLGAGSEPCPFDLCQIAILPPDRTELHARIEQRFMAMLRGGFMDEVTALRARGDLMPEMPSIKAVGYRQAWAHLDGDYSYDDMVFRAIVATRQLAKRQLTWLRGWPSLHGLEDADINVALKILESESILG